MGRTAGLFAVALALAVGSFVFLKSRPTDRYESDLGRSVNAGDLPLSVPSDDARWSERMDVLERRLGELELRLSTLSPATPRESVSDGDTDSTDLLTRRLQELEERLASWETVREVSAEERTLQRARRRRDDDGRPLDEWIAQGLDPAGTEEEKLASLRALRGRQLADGTDARLPVLQDMILLAQTSEDESVRADVWRQLDGVTDPTLLQPLLDALSFDDSRRAREEAAESLGEFLPDPMAEAALRQALDADLDENVREQAQRSLEDR